MLVVDTTLERNNISRQQEEIASKRQLILTHLETFPNGNEVTEILEKLDEELNVCTAVLARLDNANTPILRLPAEITCHIFDLARPQSKFYDDNPRLCTRRSRMEIVVSHVCQDWRLVALSYPALWSHIIIHMRVWNIHHLQSYEHLAAYLIRSRGRPLDIVATIDSVDGGMCTEALDNILNAVIPHCARWQRLLIWLNEQWDVSPLLSLAELSVPLLEVFEIGGWPTFGSIRYSLHTGQPELPDTSTIFQRGAPMLASARTVSHFLLPVQSNNISTLYIESAGQRQPWTQFAALVCLPALKYLTLEGVVFEDPQPSLAITRTVAPSLQYLRVGCPVTYSHMWRSISAPVVSVLVVFEIWDSYIEETGGSGASLAAAFPSLHTLVIWCVEFTQQDDLLHLASATPSVTKLTVYECDPEGCLILSLFQNSVDENPQLWPRLRTLTYGMRHGGRPYLEGPDGLDLPRSYKEAREWLLQLVDWRKSTFGCRCALWIDMVDIHSPDFDPRFLIDDIDSDSESDSYFGDTWEVAKHAWKALLLPEKLSDELIPWPKAAMVGGGYFTNLKFLNDSLRFGNADDHW